MIVRIQLVFLALGIICSFCDTKPVLVASSAVGDLRSISGTYLRSECECSIAAMLGFVNCGWTTDTSYTVIQNGTTLGIYPNTNNFIPYYSIFGDISTAGNITLAGQGVTCFGYYDSAAQALIVNCSQDINPAYSCLGTWLCTSGDCLTVADPFLSLYELDGEYAKSCVCSDLRACGQLGISNFILERGTNFSVTATRIFPPNTLVISGVIFTNDTALMETTVYNILVQCQGNWVRADRLITANCVAIGLAYPVACQLELSCVAGPCYADPADPCSDWQTCSDCIARNETCGWCEDTQVCMSGTGFAPSNGTCRSWNTTSDICFPRERPAPGGPTQAAIILASLCIIVVVSAVIVVVIVWRRRMASTLNHNMVSNSDIGLTERGLGQQRSTSRRRSRRHEEDSSEGSSFDEDSDEAIAAAAGDEATVPMVTTR
eukprot:TRINITY_DN3244_c0_g1_i1.p1 TRINITY_DN3244_c0_g1~~TRINITY_DN3244_c0_g1_i1.p1  ORF type:complete len:433 (-),score=44.74 TRINITY_DN3244_c0_g1_i1:720-2018(-)